MAFRAGAKPTHLFRNEDSEALYSTGHRAGFDLYHLQRGAIHKRRGGTHPQYSKGDADACYQRQHGQGNAQKERTVSNGFQEGLQVFGLHFNYSPAREKSVFNPAAWKQILHIGPVLNNMPTAWHDAGLSPRNPVLWDELRGVNTSATLGTTSRRRRIRKSGGDFGSFHAWTGVIF